MRYHIFISYFDFYNIVIAGERTTEKWKQFLVTFNSTGFGEKKTAIYGKNVYT